MHFDIEQILWALVFAAHLLLLVVLIGRDRASRFPIFTAFIALSGIRLLADHLLRGKLTSVAFFWQSYVMLILSSILGILMLSELCRIAFSSGKAGLILKAKGWLGWGMVTFAIAIAAVWFWGPWPTWKAISSDPTELPLLLTVLAAMKLEILVALLTFEVSLLLLIFGPRFGFRFKTHVQQIAIGLSTLAVARLAVQAITDTIKRTVHLTSREQYDQILRLFTNIDNGRFAIWFLVAIWWIVWLWRDEPGTPANPDLTGDLELLPAGPPLPNQPSLEAEPPSEED